MCGSWTTRSRSAWSSAASIPVGTTITEANLADYVAGLVVTNDVSARDIQLPKTQFYEAKSYPTFTPSGPRWCCWTPTNSSDSATCACRLRVNGELRQDMVVGGDMIYGPLQALQALSRFQRLDAGDLVLTGTPSARRSARRRSRSRSSAHCCRRAMKWKAFFKRQAKNTKYLKHGDVVEASVGTDDGAIDLGTQRTAVRYA